MPELPDVAILKRYLDATALHQEVAEVTVSDDYVLKRLSPDRLNREMCGHCMEASTRHGKNLLVAADGDVCLRLHFGMTGNLGYFKNSEDEPEHTRVLLSFENGFHLAYVCPRKLGRISLEKGVEEFIERAGLGPDALRIELREFLDLLDGRRGALKTTLMNQRVIAGLGNVYSDEALFQAELHPKTSVSDLDEKQRRHLFRCMRRVLETAIRNDADGRQVPRTYLMRHRGEGEDCPRCSGRITRLEVSQRGAYLCPNCQQR